MAPAKQPQQSNQPVLHNHHKSIGHRLAYAAGPHHGFMPRPRRRLGRSSIDHLQPPLLRSTLKLPSPPLPLPLPPPPCFAPTSLLLQAATKRAGKEIKRRTKKEMARQDEEEIK